jgi:uncharacterized protein
LGVVLTLLGYAAALAMGATLGLVGGGGSLLTVPVLVYLFKVSPVLATGDSLFVVGMVSLVGAIRSMKNGQLSYRTGLLFALPSFLAVWFTRHWLVPELPAVLFSVQGVDLTADIAFAGALVLGVLMAAMLLLKREMSEHPSVLRVVALMLPAAATVFVLRQWVIPRLPDHLFQIHSFSVTKDRLVMLAFAAIMFGASWAMLKPSQDAPGEAALRHPMRLGLQGLAVGLVTGFVGAGGGFLIVPALVLLAGLPMRRAVGTSLLIITINSLVGFASQISHVPTNWNLLLPLTGLAIVGLLLGAHFADRLPTVALRRGFAYGVIALAGVITVREIWFYH